MDPIVRDLCIVVASLRKRVDQLETRLSSLCFSSAIPTGHDEPRLIPSGYDPSMDGQWTGSRTN